MPMRGGEGRAAPARRLPLPKRFAVAVTDTAYDRLRALNGRYGLSNNYLLTVLLEHLDDYADRKKLDAVFSTFIRAYGAPGAATMKKSR